ncbi:HK97-gp10 family putative phage morphogenesis protein [Suttonella ornithocola]|uniref:Phage protein, HK97 gp10 family n=1 Tax=Suttonella ornithocola TaxID=279832 RepID=A0A380MRN3_9GAMM|nr:HK97-gp10 family putative phage morphogenesis protein [Suttonella ornithocola]SUO95260.1 phage protein, HK97 gp10 family [Suttonella ornithocola]
MADGVEMRLHGLEALREKLEAFTDEKRARRIYTAASRNAMKETRKKVKQNAARIDDPRTPENISANIATKVNSKHFTRNGNIYARVGVTGGAQKGKGGGGKGGDTYYWRFLEFGTSKMPARPFIRPAMDADQITGAYASELSKAIEREIKKYGAPT